MYRHTNVTHNRVISGSRHEVDENCASLRYYTAGSDNFLPTLWDSPPVPSSGLKMGPVGCPETSAINYHYSPRNIPEESSSNRRLLDTHRAIELFKDVCNTINGGDTLTVGNLGHNTYNTPCLYIRGLHEILFIYDNLFDISMLGP